MTDLANDKRGIVCPQCGASGFRVIKTLPGAGKQIRRRECLHCGHRIGTFEKIVGY
jgi:transcriptional regulator NrdR family protein